MAKCDLYFSTDQFPIQSFYYPWYHSLLARSSRNATSDWFITSLQLQRLQPFHWLISAFCGSNPTELKVQFSHLESKTLLDLLLENLFLYYSKLLCEAHVERSCGTGPGFLKADKRLTWG